MSVRRKIGAARSSLLQQARRQDRRRKELGIYRWPDMRDRASEINTEAMRGFTWKHGMQLHKLPKWRDIKHLPEDEQPRYYLGPSCDLGHGVYGGREAVRGWDHRCMHCQKNLPPIPDNLIASED